ncbi:MAG TPA: hypothetical protein VIR31_00465 [Nitrososphaeraceae archaeon]|jgi:hypothetical protein
MPKRLDKSIAEILTPMADTAPEVATLASSLNDFDLLSREITLASNNSLVEAYVGKSPVNNDSSK